jgi:hypothetical protein
MTDHRFAFCASTGRTATMFMASAMDSLPGVTALHEGHRTGDPPIPVLPLINLHNRKAWYEPGFADRVVAELRDAATLTEAAGESELLVDVAFYNAPIIAALARVHRQAKLFAIFRRCESFVLSATVVEGEDRQPAGWPDVAKPLTEREKFIALGRLKPMPGTYDAEQWPAWSAIQRNVWLWTSVNSHLLRVCNSLQNCHALFYEELVAEPELFWSRMLRELGCFSAANVSVCVDSSARKLNQRTGYHIGPIDTWSADEVALYETLALPLERQLYD